MSDIKLFALKEGLANEIPGSAVAIERSLQHLIEQNLDALLGIRLLASEYSTGPKHRGRIDTLGIDENASPVIIEYKRGTNENVINQGLYYLDWLLDHQAEFKWLVLDKFGHHEVVKIDWSAPRLLCIAGGFTRYDEHAVQQMNRNIELIRYQRFGEDLLLLELVNATTAKTKPTQTFNGKPKPTLAGLLDREMTKGTTWVDLFPLAQSFAEAKGLEAVTMSTLKDHARFRKSQGRRIEMDDKQVKMEDKTISETLAEIDGPLLELYEELQDYLLALGDDTQEKTLKFYVAFKRLRNFACVGVHPIKAAVTVYLKVDPDNITLEPGFSRDVRRVGHFGTGDLEVTIGTREDLERAKPLLRKSYESS